MPYVTREFTQYVVYFMSGGSASVGTPQDAQIDCFDSSGNGAGALYFYSSGGRLPRNEHTVTGIALYFRLARFADTLTLLQHEKPLYLNLNTDTHVGYLSTGSEPIGEQEEGDR
ncbi:MAG: hypothetical protein MUE41_02750 [Gemmatimonadaceae bacterium]|jgi:hypothetical protein|nr:hypothetical protein [Gemmatimonadaceae bacterium]